ncbi:MAG: PDZ domain-containing protein [Phycisphaerales bacterium]
MKRTAYTLLTTSLLFAATGTASAMEAIINDGFVVETPAHPHEDSKSSSKTTSKNSWIQKVNDGKHVYELRMEDDIIFVKVDGKSIPESRIKKDDKSVIVFKDDGGKLYEFDIAWSVDAPPHAPHPPRATGIGNRNIFVSSDGKVHPVDHEITVAYDELARATPKVMLGIYSDEPAESLREHLGIEGEALIVQSVIKGLSADKAGIKDNDIIISIDGSDGVSQNGLTKILGKHNPGDEIKIVVLRKGQKMSLNTKLLEYNPEALGHSKPGGPQVWVTEDDSRFPALLHNDGSAAPSFERFFSPETREKTHAKIIEALRSQGISNEKIEQIENEIIEALDRDLWSSFGQSGQDNFFRFRTDDTNNQDQRFLVESMQRKAEQAMRDAERLTLEYKDGQLLLKRHAEGLEQKLKALNEQVHESLPVIESELQGRLGELEARLDTLEEALDSQMDSLSGLIERLIDRLDEED